MNNFKILKLGFGERRIRPTQKVEVEEDMGHNGCYDMIYQIIKNEVISNILF